jgi:hypothetical protein
LDAFFFGTEDVNRSSWIVDGEIPQMAFFCDHLMPGSRYFPEPNITPKTRATCRDSIVSKLTFSVSLLDMKM